ncbi:TonB-dependent receptor [Membranihabitans maritimus]|uniref:TonB-dependent receptor n=1 Tax=Membranihabitans maritimus TaxID=2904244 RepID=UPI001F3F99DE|nr:TonB-dependent receptor plug domain-containing protein [Membranihabitans maritimus]
MKSFCIFSFFILVFNTIASSQSLEGSVQDKNTNPIENVLVVNLSNGTHTHSDRSGSILVPNVSMGDSLEFSHLGFNTKIIQVNSLEKQLSITLIPKTLLLKEITIAPETDALTLFSDIDIRVDPVNSSQDILRQVPGLFIGQHAGGGKAEQIFLRGFDIDHGTDLSIEVDGIPVNMVSHAHGQGYSDLHFIIPETVDKIDFGKGGYYADKGNFSTAGYVAFKTRESLEHNSVKLEVGQFNTQRLMGMLNVLDRKNNSAYIATEFLRTDGPFESPQNFNRINFMGKYTGHLTPTDKISLTASTFTSDWDASGQIPQRAVDNGMITRFGAIDDTEGGQTHRTNLLFQYNKSIDDKSFVKNNIYYTKYDFELFSNFTFFLEDPQNGDQIKQIENRKIYGFNSEYNRQFSGSRISGDWQAGVGLRADQIFNNELAHTVNRKEILERIQSGDVRESNGYGYLNASFDLGQWTLNPGIRLDLFHFQYQDALTNLYLNQSQAQSIASPKLNILYHLPEDHIQLYLKTGKSFHSNDTRVVIIQNGQKILPSSYNTDLGIIWKPFPNTVINTALWYLFLEQEFVYVGDAGIVEPGGKTQRQGVDFSLRYQPWEWLFWNIDGNYTYARSVEAPQEENLIPLAPDFTLSSGLKVLHPSGWYGGISVRHMDHRPANENYSITAEGYTITDFNAGYQWGKIDLGIQIQNLFNTEWNETQFATESRLAGEVNPVEEIHFTPGTPFFAKGVVRFSF